MKNYSSTTRASSRRGSRNRQLSRFGLIAVGVIIVALLLPNLFSTVSALLLTPAHAVRAWFVTSSDSLPSYLRQRSALIDELEALEQQLSQHTGTQTTVRRLENENQALKNLMRAGTPTRILASVIARPSSLPYDMIQLDQGSEDGVVLDAPVFIGYDQVVGLVTHVEERYSFATLVSSPGFTSTVYILGPNIYTPAVGMGGGVLRVRVPQGIPLEVGNLVILPSVDSGVFGEIVQTEAIPTQPEQYGYVTSGLPLASLRYVTVGTDAITERSFEEAQAEIETVKRSLFTVPVPEGVLVDTTASSSATSSATSTATSTGGGAAPQ